MIKIGMDIGTSTSSVCVDIDGEKHLIKCGTGSGSTQTFIPSAIYVKEDGTLFVGQAAEQNRSRDPQRFVKSFKRDLGINDPLIVGGKDFLPEQLIEKIILHLKECAEKSEYLNGQTVKEVTICHPANFSQKKKDLLTKAAQNAGIEAVYLLDEPTAAAQYYYSKEKIAEGEKLLIYDLGGGTFDVSLMENTTEGLKPLTKALGIDRCGGEDFNYALGEWLEQDEVLNIKNIRSMLKTDQLISLESMFEQECITGKEMLSSDTSASISLMLARTEITRETFEQLIKEYVDETISKAEEIIENAHLSKDQIDKILLIGGSCRIPYIKRRLMELAGDKVVADVDPDLAVVYGSTTVNLETIERAHDYYNKEEYDKAFKSYLTLAQSGNAIAQFFLGYMYAKGQGVTSDEQEAIKWYQKAAEQGDVDAQYNLGVRYYYGRGVIQDYKESVKWFKEAVKQENTNAFNYLGVMYAKGQGVTQDEEEAVKWYRKAAEQGEATAQYNLATRYDNGEGVIQDYKEAVKWYRKAAEQGDEDAQYYLGVRYYKGQGVTQNYKEALKWFEEAAKQGNINAYNYIGVIYGNGEGVTQDYKEAVKWYRKAAEQGNSPAQFNLGVRYEYGEGVAQNDREAVKWYRKAAEQGDVDAQYILGIRYEKGQGVTQDYKEAIKWYRKAAEQGHAEAKRILSVNGQENNNLAELWAQLEKALANNELNNADKISIQILKMCTGEADFKTMEKANRISADILLRMHLTWKKNKFGSLKSRSWFRNVGDEITYFKNWYSFKTCLEQRLEDILA